jgi:putative ABC transport system permease protein
MNWTTHVRSEFARLGKQVDESVVEELAQHATAAFEEARADGQPPDEAERYVCALVASWCQTDGPRRIAREPLMAAAPAGRSWFAGLGLDMRLAFRLLYRHPGFASVSIAMIALAIAATTSIFSVVNGVLLTPLPCCKVDGLVRVFDNVGEWTGDTPLFTNLTYLAWADKPQTIDGIGAWSDVSLTLDTPAGVELVRAARVTASLFPLLGVVPVLGVHFSDADEGPDEAVILSYGFWQERFGGAPNVLGRRFTIAGKPRTIVGVMPQSFEFPTGEQRVWLPTRVDPVSGADGGIHLRTFDAVARLKRGATAAQAASEGSARAAGVPLRGNENMRNELFVGGAPAVVVAPMLDWIVRDVKPALWILLAAVCLLFTAAAGNVANMQLARAAERRREAAIRAAIGAGAGRLARQLFVETSTIAALGGALGLGLTFLVMRALPALLPDNFPRVQDVAIDGRVLAAVTALTTAVSVIMSLLPVRMARRLNVTSALVEDGCAPVGHDLRSPLARARALIVAGQVAVAAVLLVGAALLSQSFVKHVGAERGYQPAGMLTARITHIARGLPPNAGATFYQDVLERLTATRGVTHAALSNSLPLTADRGADFWQNPSDKTSQTLVVLRLVSADYFPAMGMRITRGRPFTGAETPTSEPVVLVNEAFARRYLSGDPLEATAHLIADHGRPDLTAWRIIGVVADVKHHGAEDPVKPEVFAATTQLTAGPSATQYVAVRTTGDPATLVADLRAIVRGASVNAALEQVMTMETRLMASLARPRLYAVLLGGFAVFALFIAVVGIFGGLSYAVSQRTREIGVRTALGATPGDIVALVVRQGVAMTLVGLAIGFLVAGWAGRYLSGFLFGVTPADPVTFVVVGVAFTAIAAVAYGIPARRAAKVDPIDALRH